MIRLVVQRVLQASVTIKETGETRSIGPGLMVLVGVGLEATPQDVDTLAEKVTHLRIFDDSEGRMNLSLRETQGEMLIVSQFTLMGDTRKGRRPSWTQAARPELAVSLYERFVERIKAQGIGVQTGDFGADMLVNIDNDGPVTLVMDSL